MAAGEGMSWLENQWSRWSMQGAVGMGGVKGSLAMQLGLVCCAAAVQLAAHLRLDLAAGSVVGAGLFLVAVEGASVRRGSLLGAVFGGLIAMGFLPQSPGLAVSVLSVVLWMCCSALVGTVFAVTTRPGRHLAWLLVCGPATVGVLELVTGGFSPLGDYLGVAASVAGLEVLHGLARFGLPVIAGGAVLAGLGAGLLCTRGSQEGRRRWGLSALLLPVLLAQVPWFSAEWTRNLRVAAVALQEQGRSREPLEVARALGALTDRAAEGGARVVVWPETAVALRSDPARKGAGEEEVLAELREVARRNELTVVVGAFVEELDQNQALVFGPGGDLEGRYSKHHLIPGMESYRAGPVPAGAVQVEGGAVMLGLQICFDDCFGDGLDALVDQRISLLALPTRDWPEVAARHRKLSVLRAVQGGVGVVRAAHGGFSQVIDGRGRLLAEANSLSAGTDVLLVADLPLP